MDALLPAFVAALLAEFGDKSLLLAMALAAHFGRARAVLAGVSLAAAVNAALAAFAGAMLAPLMTPEARGLLLALALILAGAGALLPVRAPDVARWRVGAFASSFLAFLILGFGDKTLFVTAAIAARTASPILAACGGAAGVIVASGAALALGPQLPAAQIRKGAAALLLLGGLFSGVTALRLIQPALI